MVYLLLFYLFHTLDYTIDNWQTKRCIPLYTMDTVTVSYRFPVPLYRVYRCRTDIVLLSHRYCHRKTQDAYVSTRRRAQATSDAHGQARTCIRKPKRNVSSRNISESSLRPAPLLHHSGSKYLPGLASPITTNQSPEHLNQWCCVCAVFTLRRPLFLLILYPTTFRNSSVRRDSSSQRLVQVMWSHRLRQKTKTSTN